MPKIELDLDPIVRGQLKAIIKQTARNLDFSPANEDVMLMGALQQISGILNRGQERIGGTDDTDIGKLEAQA